MALGSTQPLTEMSTMKCGNLNFLEPSGPLQVCNGTALTLCAIACSDRELYGGFTELAVSMSLSVKLDGLGNVLEQLTL